MIITVQHVASPVGVHGYNVYEYSHHDAPIPNPVAAITQNVPVRYFEARWEQVPAGGNNVLSYLDIAVPDGPNFFQYSQMYSFLDRVADLAAGAPPPANYPIYWHLDNCAAFLNVNAPHLRQAWFVELKQLARHALLP